MNIRCAWCQSDMGDMPPDEDPGQTHDICGHCSQTYFEQLQDVRQHSAAPRWHPADLFWGLVGWFGCLLRGRAS